MYYSQLRLQQHSAGHQKSVLIREVSLYPKSHYMYYSWMELCSGHGHSVVIRELSLYPQSLLAKLTVCEISHNAGPPEAAINWSGRTIVSYCCV